MRWVKFTERTKETKLVQFNASKNFSGVNCRAPSGIKRDETVCKTPLDAYMSGSTSSASDTMTLSAKVTTFNCLPSRVVTTLR